MMHLDDLLLILGAATVLVGMFSEKLSPILAKRRRVILTVGVLMLAFWSLLGMPAFVEGVREGYRETLR